MTTTVFETGAIFALEDRFSTNLDRLLGGLAKAEGSVKTLQASLDRLGLGGMAGLSTKFAAEWAEIDKVTARGVDGVLKKVGRLGVEMSPLFGEMTKGARSAFGDITTAAKVMKQDVVDQMQFAGTFGPAAIKEGIDAAAPGMFSPIVTASKIASDETVANLAKIGGAVEAATVKAQAAGAGTALERRVWGDQTRGPRSGGFGRSGRGDGLHFGRVGGDIGGVHMSVGGNIGMAAAGVALDGIYESALIDEAVAKALATSQIPIGPGVSKTDAGKRIHDMIQNSSRMTGFGFHDSGEAILEGQRLLSQMDFGKRNDLIESIIPSAAYEARMKGSTLPEAIEAIIGIAHQTQTYDPAGIQKIAKNLAYTSLLTPSPLPQFQNALGYSMPELHNGLDMDPSTIMLLTATMQQSGIRGTKSGTWLRSFFENSEPGNDEHNEALRKLGMLNGDNKPSWRTTGADGKVDWQASVTALSGILQHDQQTIPVDERIGLLRKAYGERGAGFASLMMGEKFTENLAGATKGMNSFKGGEDILGQYASASVLQQGRVALQDFNVAVSDLGTKLMPGATKAVSEFSEIMRTIDTDGPKGLLKLFYDKAVRPDIDPVLKQVMPGPGDLKLKNLDPGADASGLDAMRNGLFHKEAFTSGILGGANDNVIDVLAQGVFRGLTMYASGGASGGGMGGGVMNVAYGGGGGSGGGALSPLMRGRIGGAFHGDGGSNPYLGGPSAGAFVAPVGDHLTAGMRNNNLGNIGFFGQHTAGLIGPSNARDVDHSIARFDTQESGIRAAAGLALHKYLGGRHDTWGLIAAKGGWTPGALGPGASVNVARAMGLGNHDDLHLDQPGQMVKFLHGLAIQEHGPSGRFYSEDRIRGALGHVPTVSAPRPRVTPGAPASAGPSAMNVTLHNHTHLDGKVIAKSTTKHSVGMIAQALAHPTSNGGPDGHGHYRHGGVPVTDAA